MRLRINRYLFAVLLTLLAVGLEMLLQPLFHGRAPLTLFGIAVMVAASRGGLGPGILATLLGVGCIELLFARSIFTVLQSEPGAWLLGGFGVAISVLIEGFRRRNEELARTKELLEAVNKELQKRSKDLAGSNEELKHFAYALCHDLQTPIRNIGVLTEQVAREIAGKVDDETAESMRLIVDSARRGQRMIQHLLAYSLASHQGPNNSRTDLNAVLAEALEEIRLAAKESGARITSERLPTVRADGEQLRQVFLNLLGNAIKYRSACPPEIHVTARRAAKNGFSRCAITASGSIQSTQTKYSGFSSGCTI